MSIVVSCSNDSKEKSHKMLEIYRRITPIVNYQGNKVTLNELSFDKITVTPYLPFEPNIYWKNHCHKNDGNTFSPNLVNMDVLIADTITIKVSKKCTKLTIKEILDKIPEEKLYNIRAFEVITDFAKRVVNKGYYTLDVNIYADKV